MKIVVDIYWHIHYIYWQLYYIGTLAKILSVFNTFFAVDNKMKPKINSTINLNMEKIRELTELITKITEIQIKEISDSWLKAKEILKTIEAEKNGPPKNVARQGGET